MNKSRLILLALALPLSFSFSATFNVSNEQEFQNALDAAYSNGEDDVINLSEGTYSLSSNYRFKYDAGVGGTDDGKSLTINGAGIDKTIIDYGGVFGKSLLYISSSNGGNFTIKNLTIRGGDTTFTDLYGTQNFTGGGLYLTVRDDVLIENVKFQSNTAGIGEGGGAYVSSSRGNITIRNCIFYKNLAKTGAGLNIGLGDWQGISAGNLYLYNNIFYHNGGYQGAGFHIYQYSSGDINIVNNTIVGNVIFSTANDPNTAFGAGGYILVSNQNAGKINIYNNIFWNNENNARQTDKVNDLFLNNTQAPKDVSIYNNNLNLNDTNSFAPRYQINANVGNNIYQDPKLQDINNLNFLPSSNSPMVDKGENTIVNSLNISKDFAGNNRIYNGTVDIGALEYSPSSVSTPPSAKDNGSSSSSSSSSSSGGGGCSFGVQNTYITLIFIFTLAILRALRRYS